MADPKNPGQFGNRPDTEMQAHRGGQMSGGKFQPGSNRASAAGRKGGGRSHRNG